MLVEDEKQKIITISMTTNQFSILTELAGNIVKELESQPISTVKLNSVVKSLSNTCAMTAENIYLNVKAPYHTKLFEDLVPKLLKESFWEKETNEKVNETSEKTQAQILFQELQKVYKVLKGNIFNLPIDSGETQPQILNIIYLACSNEQV